MLHKHHIDEMKLDNATMVSTGLNLSLSLFQTLPVCKARTVKRGER